VDNLPGEFHSSIMPSVQESTWAIPEDNHPEQSLREFYFGSKLRSLIVLPLVLFLLVQPITVGIFTLLIMLDGIVSLFVIEGGVFLHFLFVLIFLTVGWWLLLGVSMLNLAIASFPLVSLQTLWNSKLWGIAKIGLFILAFPLSLLVPSLGMGLEIAAFESFFGYPGLSIWWLQLTGVLLN